MTIRTAQQAHADFVSGNVSATELVKDSLSAIESRDGSLNSMLHVATDAALQAALSLDEKRRAGQSCGPLAGVCVAVKDLICTQGMPTTCGSRILESFVPPYDATVIERLRSADAIVVGKTNLDEFGMGSSNENSAFGRVCNPWSLERVSGGSSGGSAAAVAADLVPLALGTDTGGSIRQPAAFCGVVGIKPTYGAVSRYGMVAYASSLDQIGPMARTAADCELMLKTITGHDSRDSTSSNKSLEPSAWSGSLKGLRVGVVEADLEQGVSPSIRERFEETRQWLLSQGATIVPITLPRAQYGIATYYLIAASEASSNLSRYDGAHYGRRAAVTNHKTWNLDRMYSQSRVEGLGAEVKRRILLGTFALSAGYADAFYGKASRARRAIQLDFYQAFQQCDVILSPTSPTEAFLAGEKTSNPLEMYLADVFTVLANLAGLPAVSFPVGFTPQKLPIGLQLIGRPFEDLGLLSIVDRYQQQTDWHIQCPSSRGV